MSKKQRRARRQFGSFENLEAKQLLHGSTFDLPLMTDQICLAAPREESSEQAEPVDVTEETTPSSFGRFDSLAAYKEYWIEQAIERYKHLLGTKTSPWYDYPIILQTADWIVDFAADDNENSSVAYDTNTQVADIDEADIVETDGQFVYVLNGRTLTIVDARDTDSLSVVSRVELQDQPSAMYLHEGRLSIISDNYGRGWRDRDVWIMSTVYYPYNDQSSLTVFDVSDPSNPNMIQRTEFDGSIVDSRAVDGQLYLVIQDSVDLPRPEYTEMTFYGPLPYSPYWNNDNIYGFHESYVYESEESYRERLESLPDSVFLPGFTSLDASGETIAEGSLNTADEIYTSLGDTNNIVSIVSIDMHDDGGGIQHSTSVVGIRAEGIYMSEESIYVYHQYYDSPETNGDEIWFDDSQTRTHLTKFDVSDGEPVLAATGTVKGWVDSQFSLDEHDGYLRIATTTGWWDGEGNNLYVLEQNGDTLETVGSIENLAPNEQIYSVRFMGDRAYVVTFEIIDPLFSIDLSDPTNPEVKGELKIPGFSDYLQPIDENHLIGIGRNVDENTGWFEELQISLFNVEDMSEPILVDQYSFEGGWTGSTIAEWDHHAVSYFSEFNTLTIPVSMGGYDWWSGAWSEPSDSVYVFEIDVDNGISLDGTISHQDQALRTLLIGDSILSMSASELISVDIDDVTTIQSTLDVSPNYRLFPEPITIEPIGQPIVIPFEDPVVASSLIEEAPVEPAIEFDVMDLNQDGLISALDADLIMAALDDPTTLSGNDQDRFDLNGDGFLTAIDALQIVNHGS